MKSAWHTSLLLSILSFASFQMHAAQVVLTFDVTPTQIYEGRFENGEVRTPIGGTLTPFQITYGFDTEYPWLDTPGTSSTVYVSSLFHQGSSTTTPYTSWLQAPLPLEVTPDWPLYTQVVYGHSITDYDGPAVPRVSWEFMGLNTGMTWFGKNPEVWESTGYNRGISWSEKGPMISRNEFHALNANEVISWLESHKGLTLEGAFNESVTVVKHSNLPSSNSGADSLMYWRSIGVTGDVVLREVSVVPEPASLPLMLFGTMAVVLAVTRGRRRSG